jgi:hypothetical protein
MLPSDRPPNVLPASPTERPLERFWPYAELSESPSEEELAAVHPELRSVLFGAPVLPFSISIVFPAFPGSGYDAALQRARQSDEYTEFEVEGQKRHRARFYPGSRPVELRDLYDMVGALPETDVLVDDRPVPYARELWLPLVWMLIR